MKSIVILCNGEFPKKEYPLYLLRTADIIVCCDSRYNIGRLKKLGLEPTLIVGDMDSTPLPIRQQYADRLVHLSGQDDNDLAKAFNTVRERWPEASRIYILGAGGKDEAHTIGNFGWLMEWESRAMAEFTGAGPSLQEQGPAPSTCPATEGAGPNGQACSSSAFAAQGAAPSTSLAAECAGPSLQEQGPAPQSYLEAQGLKVEMISDYSTAFVVSGLSPVELYVGEGRKLSFFSTDPSLRLRSTGLVWPLEGIGLSKWWAATLNRADSDIITLQFSHPSPLLIIMD